MTKDVDVVHCTTLAQWQTINSKLPDKYKLDDESYLSRDFRFKLIQDNTGATSNGRPWLVENGYTVYSFDEWMTKENLNRKNAISMEDMLTDVLNKTYNNDTLRKTTVPLFMGNPGGGKTSIIKQFAKDKGVRMLKITLSQRMPNEVVGMVMPDTLTSKLVVYDSHELNSLNDGDILFFDEVFNGTLKQTLDAVLNLLEDRVLPSGKPLADVMIVAASNPQGLINLTPQIKERFIRYDLKFNKEEYQTYLKNKYGMPHSISNNLCILIGKEKFEHDLWNFNTPRSIEKAINQIGCDLISPYNDLILPFLNEQIVSPMDITSLEVNKGDKIEYVKLLKLILQANVTKNKECKSGVTTNLAS